MKIATFSKIIAAAALVAAPMVAQAQGAQREGAAIGSSEMLAVGGLLAALAAVAGLAGGSAVAAGDSPTSP